MKFEKDKLLSSDRSKWEMLRDAVSIELADGYSWLTKFDWGTKVREIEERLRENDFELLKQWDDSSDALIQFIKSLGVFRIAIDRSIVDGLLRRDEELWEQLSKEIQRQLSFHRLLRFATEETLENVRQWMLVEISKDDLAILRRYDPTKSKLMSFLQSHVLKGVRDAIRKEPKPFKIDDIDVDRIKGKTLSGEECAEFKSVFARCLSDHNPEGKTIIKMWSIEFSERAVAVKIGTTRDRVRTPLIKFRECVKKNWKNPPQGLPQSP